MHVFQVKGLSGLIMFIVSMAAMMIVAFFIPTLFILALWNALVFETFAGPEISLAQAGLLWVMALIIIKLTVNPQIALQFQRVDDPNEIESRLKELDQKRRDKEAK